MIGYLVVSNNFKIKDFHCKTYKVALAEYRRQQARGFGGQLWRQFKTYELLLINFNGEDVRHKNIRFLYTERIKKWKAKVKQKLMEKSRSTLPPAIPAAPTCRTSSTSREV